jgi:His/Glu/Gln/Arg/opine family amino acid ABC transporter permease subunit
MEHYMNTVTLLTEALPYLLQGALVTLKIAAGSSIIGLTLGAFLGLAHTRNHTWLRAAITVYVGILRGTPMLIQIFFLFTILPMIGIYIPSVWVAIVAIGINSSAYISQTIRSGINAVSKGQLEAAKVLGLTRWQTTRFIVLPQALRIVFPALLSEFTTLIKDSSLASTIGAVELFKQGNIIMNRTYAVLPIYMAIAVIYLCLTTTLSILSGYVERKMNVNA